MDSVIDQRPERADLRARQSEILEQIRRRGYVSVEKLAKTFRVSEQTVRRDIKELAGQGLVVRYHGGAGLPADAGPLAYANRKVRFAEEKRRIGAAVAARVPNGSSVFIDIGTTMEAVAEALVNHRGLRVITNHITVATILSSCPDFEIIIAGGVLRHRDHAITGEATSEFLERFRVGFGVFGIGGVDRDGELLDYDFRDVQVSKTAMSIARRRFVALDHSKFETDAMVRLAHLAEVDAIFTDRPPPPGIQDIVRRHGVEVVLP